MNPSIVAMLGRIIPAPLLIPVIVTSTPSIFTRWLKALGTVSVVMMPSAARNQLSGPASARAAGSPASMRSTGKGSMMTPVENGSICSGASSSLRARAMQVARARTRPSSPVPALALPVLMTMARMSPRARCSRHTCTGAAQKRFWVNTPATAGARVDQDDGQVLPVGFADAGFGDSDAHARDGMQLVRARGAVRLTGMAWGCLG